MEAVRGSVDIDGCNEGHLVAGSGWWGVVMVMVLVLVVPRYVRVGLMMEVGARLDGIIGDDGARRKGLGVQRLQPRLEVLARISSGPRWGRRSRMGNGSGSAMVVVEIRGGRRAVVRSVGSVSSVASIVWPCRGGQSIQMLVGARGELLVRRHGRIVCASVELRAGRHGGLRLTAQLHVVGRVRVSHSSGPSSKQVP